MLWSFRDRVERSIGFSLNLDELALKNESELGRVLLELVDVMSELELNPDVANREQVAEVMRSIDEAIHYIIDYR